ncbi:SDR_e domain containing protein [Rhabdaerophilaceae bacterium]
MSEFTIFGASGFVGSALVRRLTADGRTVRIVTRQTWPAPGVHLGHVIFTIGMTADFREKPFETVDSQVIALHRALIDYQFSSFLGLSSTRVYRGAVNTSEEAALLLNPANPDDLYNATKLAGEALLLTLRNPEIRVARLSNIYGTPAPSSSFLAAVIAEAQSRGSVVFRTGAQSAKDYLAVDSAIEMLVNIAERGKHRLYNVASGKNTSNGEIMSALGRLGIACRVEPAAPEPIFPEISTLRVQAEFPSRIPDVLEALPALLADQGR